MTDLLDPPRHCASPTPPTSGATPEAPSSRGWTRVRAGLVGAWVAVTGAAPHVLHHVGPLAGTALIAGAGGRVVFGVVGFVATIPMLRRLRRRSGGWRAPVLALAGLAVLFTFSSLVVGPALTRQDEPAPTTPGVVVDHHGHDTEEPR